MTKVLIVEDDIHISKSLELNLNLSGFSVFTASTIEDGWNLINQKPFQIGIFDVNLPDGTGIQLCQRVRNAGIQLPILFLSAQTDDETVLKGFQVGAEDYMRKPFGVDELKARMNRILQRNPTNRKIIEAGPLVIDVEKRQASILGNVISLGKKEFDILTCIAKKGNDVVTREHIINTLETQTGEESSIFDRTIDSHLSHLRKKIREKSNEALQIVSVYGVGYRLDWKKE